MPPFLLFSQTIHLPPNISLLRGKNKDSAYIAYLGANFAFNVLLSIVPIIKDHKLHAIIYNSYYVQLGMANAY